MAPRPTRQFSDPDFQRIVEQRARDQAELAALKKAEAKAKALARIRGITQDQAAAEVADDLARDLGRPPTAAEVEAVAGRRGGMGGLALVAAAVAVLLLVRG